MILKHCAVALCLTLGLTMWPSCRGGNAAVTPLPNPAADDRPPGSPPELPRIAVELPPDGSGPVSVVVREGDDLQRAINNAKPGDTIAVQAGAVFRGPFTLPNRGGAGWVTIRTNAPDSSLPPRGTCVTPADARAMAVIETEDDAAIRTDAAAHGYRFIGIEIRPMAGSFVYNLVLLGDNPRSTADLPHHIEFDRCYIHGDAGAGSRRGIALNGAHIAVVDSWLSDLKENGNDSQAIAAWDGTGPFLIENSHLEAAGENLMFGGADPAIDNLVPSDIVIRGNELVKPLQWRGASWTVKNLFELKNARRVLVENNLMENNWEGAQNGYAVLMTVRNQDGASPWSMVRDVTFRNNVIRHVSSAINILGSDDIHQSQQTKRILISNNIFDDVSDVQWGGVGNLMQINNGAADVTIEHNTGFATNAFLVASGAPNAGFSFTNNLVAGGAYGAGGDSHYGDPMGALTAYFPGCAFQGNVVIGAKQSRYPSGNYFPPAVTDVGFVDYQDGDYRLTPESAYGHAATDGKSVGADLSVMTPPPARRRAVQPSH